MCKPHSKEHSGTSTRIAGTRDVGKLMFLPSSCIKYHKSLPSILSSCVLI